MQTHKGGLVARSLPGVLTPLLFFAFIPSTAQPQSEAGAGWVIEVRADRGEAVVRFPEGAEVSVGDAGTIYSRQGPVDFQVSSLRTPSEGVVRFEDDGRIEGVRPGDRASLRLPLSRVRREVSESLDRIDALLMDASPEAMIPIDLAPDLLTRATGETLLDYEAWLLQLESEEVAPAFRISEPPPTERPPTFPNLTTRQWLRTGVDYDQFVYHATGEAGAPRLTERQIGRTVRWNLLRSGSLDPHRRLSFENRFEANQDFVYEEMNLGVQRELPGGDRFWWNNRSILKVFQNDQGDSFFQNDLEARHVRKLSENWEWQRGVRLDWRTEYDETRDDGFLRGSVLSEWNYRDGFDSWGDLGYELTREIRNDSENSSQEFWEHRLYGRWFQFEEDSRFDFSADFFYRDYNQPGTEEDEFTSVWTAAVRRRASDQLMKGWRLTLEPRLYPTTEDLNSNAVRAEAARIYEFNRGSELFLSLEPRIAQVFHFGEVPDDIPLDPRLPRDKSEGDYREAGLNFSLSWFPNERWRVNLFEDVYHRWFPHGETGVTAFYLYDFPRIADFTGVLSTLSIDYIPRKDLELSLRASHTKQFYDVFDENESSSFNIGLEATYRF